MELEYGRIDVEPKIGDEPFVLGGQALGFDLLSFWRWSGSDLVGNTSRGILAEYIVARALGIDSKVRIEWDAFDLVTAEGLRIEVKSSSYIQSWDQKGLSKIVFGIQPTRGWDAATNQTSPEFRRHADVYIFCVLAHLDQQTLNPLDVKQWEFYVVPTTVLDQTCSTQKSIGLAMVRAKAGEPVSYESLAQKVHELRVIPRAAKS